MRRLRNSRYFCKAEIPHSKKSANSEVNHSDNTATYNKYNKESLCASWQEQFTKEGYVGLGRDMAGENNDRVVTESAL